MESCTVPPTQLGVLKALELFIPPAVFSQMFVSLPLHQPCLPKGAVLSLKSFLISLVCFCLHSVLLSRPEMASLVY